MKLNGVDVVRIYVSIEASCRAACSVSADCQFYEFNIDNRAENCVLRTGFNGKYVYDKSVRTVCLKTAVGTLPGRSLPVITSSVIPAVQ